MLEVLSALFKGPGPKQEQFSLDTITVLDENRNAIPLKMALVDRAALTLSPEESQAAKNKIARAFALNPEMVKLLQGKLAEEAKQVIEGILATKQN